MDEQTQPNPIHTSALLRGLFKASQIESYLQTEAAAFKMQPFHEFICELCEQKGMLRVEVVRRSGIERSYGFQIFQGTKKPSRDKVIQIAIGFELDYEGTQELLKYARHSALYPRFKRDAAIIYCLNKRLGFTQTQEMLARIGSPILGKEPGA